ncbi:hypothetical protein EYC80_006963 [Monilinia laxa]|uniref:Uncharacterized protein n=1 Tax=Monilinia laxa TaxID=61186 RepID=A0A5N6JZP6_MONLA|nr:hypothetical protein EYC80_006963 [Monilinia laxa]
MVQLHNGEPTWNTKRKTTLHLHLHSTSRDANTTKKIDERDQYYRYPQASKMPSTPRINHHAPTLIIATHCNCQEREKDKKENKERKKERKRLFALSIPEYRR